MSVEVELRTWQIVAAEVIEESDTEKLYELIEELNRLLIGDGDEGHQAPPSYLNVLFSRRLWNPDPIILCR